MKYKLMSSYTRYQCSLIYAQWQSITFWVYSTVTSPLEKRASKSSLNLRDFAPATARASNPGMILPATARASLQVLQAAAVASQTNAADGAQPNFFKILDGYWVLLIERINHTSKMSYVVDSDKYRGGYASGSNFEPEVRMFFRISSFFAHAQYIFNRISQMILWYDCACASFK